MSRSFIQSMLAWTSRSIRSLSSLFVPAIVLAVVVGAWSIRGLHRASDCDQYYYAAACGDVAVMRELIESNPNLDAPDQLGYTQLALAASFGRRDAVELLLSRGATVDKPHPQLGTPLMLALTNGHADVARALLLRGADACVQINGWDAIGSAVRSENLECLELVLDTGANLHIADRRCGLLTLAAFGSDTQMLSRLLKAGVDPNVPDADGSMPLSNAIECGATEAARLLLQAGADPYRTGPDGRTPHAVAQWRNCQELLALLTSDGAKAVYSRSTTP